MSRHVWWLVLALGWLAGCSCGGTKPCTQSSECAATEQCTSGKCVTSCANGAACPQGTSCRDGVCRAGCTADTGCATDEACAAGSCLPRACNSQSCATGNVCVAQACVAITCVGVNCPAGQSCASGSCLPTTCGGVACAPSEVCVSGSCQDAACVGVACPAGTCIGGSCVSADGGLPFSLLCDAMARGYRNATLVDAKACGADTDFDEDYDHQPIFSSSGGGPPSASLNSFLFQFVGCSIDAGNTAVPGIIGAELGMAAASIDAGRLRYDGTQAVACITGGATDAGVAAQCHQVFVPLVGPGGACSLTEECPADFYCQPGAPSTCAGTCQPRLARGAPCELSRDLCLTGSCTQSSGAGFRCTSPADAGNAAGSPCPSPGGTSTCSSGLRCVIDPAAPDGGPAGVCTAPAGPGQRCGIGLSTPQAPACTTQCASCLSLDGGVGTCRALGAPNDACAQQADCRQFNECVGGRCTPLPRPGAACRPQLNGFRGNCRWGDNFCKQAGPDAGTGSCTGLPGLNDPCGDRFDLAEVCSTGYCERSGAVGVCKPIPTLGEPCTTSCSGSLRCQPRDGGTPTCQPLPSAGQPCASSSCGTDSRCVANLCVARGAAGAACTSDDECLSVNCLDAQHVCAEECFSPLSTNKSYTTGCPNGLRDWTILLAFSTIGFAARGRRRD